VARDLPPSTGCKFCPAQVRWALYVEKYKLLPIEVGPDPRGPWVLEEDDVLQKLVAIPFDQLKHGGRERYRSHLERCRPQQRGPSSPTPARPDPTVGLKFPRRRALPRFPPLDEMMRRLVLPPPGVVQLLTPAEQRWAEGEVARG